MPPVPDPPPVAAQYCTGLRLTPALRRRAPKTDLEEHIHKRSAVVDRMDGLLNMKTQIMEEVKMENVSLDSQLQASAPSAAAGCLFVGVCLR